MLLGNLVKSIIYNCLTNDFLAKQLENSNEDTLSVGAPTMAVLRYVRDCQGDWLC